MIRFRGVFIPLFASYDPASLYQRALSLPPPRSFPLRFSKRSDRRVTGLHLADSFDRRSFSFSFLLLRRRCNSKDSMPSYEIHCHPITIIIESRLRISFRRYVIFSLRSIMSRGLWFRITSLRELEEELRNCNIYIKTRCIDFGLLFARNVFFISIDLLLLLSSSPLPLFSIRLHDNEFRVIRFWFADNARVCYF